MSYMNTVQTANGYNAEAAERISDKISDFAHNMRSVPRKVITCEVYGTKSAAVDQAHAMNVFRKVFGYQATATACYRALAVLADRLDDDQARGYSPS